MALFPDYGRKIFSEENVDVPAGLKTVSAYDLALYPELGNHRRGVLVVTVIGSFTFKDGKKDDGTPLTWTGAQKTAYLNDFKRAAVQTWTDKHRITTASLVATIKDVGVMFDVRVAESMSVFRHSHWNIAVTRTDKYRTSGVYGDGGGLCTNGDAFLDSQDVTATNVGGPALQRACVHEFGHMPGYRDEYPTRPGRHGRRHAQLARRPRQRDEQERDGAAAPLRVLRPPAHREVPVHRQPAAPGHRLEGQRHRRSGQRPALNRSLASAGFWACRPCAIHETKRSARAVVRKHDGRRLPPCIDGGP